MLYVPLLRRGLLSQTDYGVTASQIHGTTRYFRAITDPTAVARIIDP